jgi:hypothetical protein
MHSARLRKFVIDADGGDHDTGRFFDMDGRGRWCVVSA